MMQRHDIDWAGFSLYTLVAAIVASRIAMPLLNAGSFIDEYLHISAAMTHFEWAYLRGQYVSYLAMQAMDLFGRSLLTVKMIPALMGVLNTLLVLAVARATLPTTGARILALLLYGISPWVVFNHFYLRMYVFLETAVLVNLAAACLLYDARRAPRNWQRVLLVATQSAVTLVYLAYTRDHSKWLPLGVLAVGHLAPLAAAWAGRRQAVIGGRTWQPLPLLAAALLLGLCTWSLASGQNLFYQSIGAKLVYTDAAYKYFEYFFSLNLPLTLLFAFGILAGTQSPRPPVQILSYTGLALFTVHALAGFDFQFLRAILYFHPVWLLLGAYGVSQLPGRRWAPTLAAVVGVAVTLRNYPEDFLRYPHIPREVEYRDYHDAFEYVRRQGPNAEFYPVTVLPDQIAAFYGVTPSAVITDTATNPTAHGPDFLATELRGHVDRFLASPNHALMLIDPEGWLRLDGQRPLWTTLRAGARDVRFHGYTRVFDKPAQ